MRQLVATLRHRPGPLVGTFVALCMAALVVTIATTMGWLGFTLKIPTDRLAATTAVVTGPQHVQVATGSGKHTSDETVTLKAYHRVPVTLASELAAVPGVAAAVPDRSVPVALQLPGGRIVTGTGANPVTGHGWDSAVLAPFTLASGQQPTGPDQLVVGTGLARQAGLTVGSTVRVVGRDLRPFQVVGLADSAAGNPADDWTVFFSDAEAAALYGHPGQADLIGVVAKPGASVPAVDAAVQQVATAHGASVATGADRGKVDDLAAATDGTTLRAISLGAGIDLAAIALFVVAGAVALSVAQRSRTLALLRAVGATPSQVRRMVALELGVIGAVAGLVAYLPGVWLSSLAARGMASHQFLPPGTGIPVTPWILLIAVGAGVVVAELSGFVATRRAGRTPPAAAVAGSRTERRWPGPIRLVLGLIALGGGVTLGVFALGQATSPADQLNLALMMLLCLLVAVALLGPLLVAAAELVVRLPLRALSPVAGRLAAAEVRGRPRRMASAVMSVALAVAFLGAVYVIDATASHASAVQGPQRMAASQVLTAPGPGLAPASLTAVRAIPGVRVAVGVTPTTVVLPGGTGNGTLQAEAVTGGGPGAGPGGGGSSSDVPGAVPAVLRLGVTSGSLAHFGPGDIALSRLAASQAGGGGHRVHVGQTVTAHLADGTPYRATVSAIYSRSFGFADVVVPWGAAGGGHMGTTTLGQILVADSGGTVSTPGTGTAGSAGMAGSAGTSGAAGADQALSALADQYPGLQAAPRSAVNAHYEQLTGQTSYLNNIIIVLILALAAVTLVNTLVVSTLERRDGLRMLWRIGTTRGQLLASMAWQSVVVGVVGVVLGVATGAAAVIGVSKALTDSWQPYVPWPTVVAVLAGVLALSAVATLGPTMGLLRKVDPGASSV